MVIENICYPTAKTVYNSKSDLEKLKRIALTYVKRDKDHPAILMWSIWNDMPFRWSKEGSILKKYDRRIVNAFLKEVYKAINEYLRTGILPPRRLIEQDPVVGFYLKTFPQLKVLGITDKNFWREDEPCGGHMVIEYMDLKNKNDLTI